MNFTDFFIETFLAFVGTFAMCLPDQQVDAGPPTATTPPPTIAMPRTHFAPRIEAMGTLATDGDSDHIFAGACLTSALLSDPHHSQHMALVVDALCDWALTDIARSADGRQDFIRLVREPDQRRCKTTVRLRRRPQPGDVSGDVVAQMPLLMGIEQHVPKMMSLAREVIQLAATYHSPPPPPPPIAAVDRPTADGRRVVLCAINSLLAEIAMTADDDGSNHAVFSDVVPRLTGRIQRIAAEIDTTVI